MGAAEAALLAFYLLTLCGLTYYGAHRAHMVLLDRRHRGQGPKAPLGPDDAELPVVTVQLPLYNERYVVERLIDAVARLDYPQDRLEIQVLDDSTDETQALARAAVERHRAAGLDIVWLHRQDRQGFKAGALQAGLTRARGALLAIFDADFVPPPDFLRRAVPHLTAPDVGMVQARWDHLNRRDSALTRAQAALLDAHFLLEHRPRSRSGRFFNFNGTAGLWRRAAIDSAGGWSHDTLTEDLDLSYRAQLAGWRFVFLDDLLAPAELPADLNAFKAQQHRWAKGSVQVALKLLPRLLRAELPLKVKHEAFVHLTGNAAYLLLLALSLLLPPTLRLRVELGLTRTLWLDAPVLAGATLSICAFYLEAQRAAGRTWPERLRAVPLVMALGIGLAVNNARAALEALLGQQSEFVRTPKLGLLRPDAGAPRSAYRAAASLQPLAELALCAYHLDAALYAAAHGLYGALAFLSLFVFGFLYAGLGSLQQSAVERLRRLEADPAEDAA